MTSTDFNPEVLEQGTVMGSDGDTIGKVGQVYLDNDTGAPKWVTVKTGWFGSSESFVPLESATVDGDAIRVPYDKDMIKGAPQNEAGVPLTESDEHELYGYYGVGGQASGDAELATSHDGAPADSNSEYLTRSEEQLHVGTETVETGRARLRKFVVTENQTVTVPVSHEEVRLVREPIGAGEATGDETIGDGNTDVVLSEERVVVKKETVPVERISLGTETVTEQQEVTEAVRKEQVEFDDGSSADRSDGPAADQSGENR